MCEMAFTEELEVGDRATFRGRERCGPQDGVTDGKVVLSAIGSWSNSSEKDQTSVCTRVHHGQLERESC